MEHTFSIEAAAHKVRAQFISEGRACSLVGFDTAREVYAFDADEESVGFPIVEDFGAGDIVEATTRSSRPRTVRVTLSQTPYTNRNGDIVLLGDGGPVVVDPSTVERHGPTVVVGCRHFLSHGLSESYACGADAVGRRHTDQENPANTNCRDCRQTDAWQDAVV